MTHTIYIAKVKGLAWAGYKASTEYTFDYAPSKEEIKRQSGDFQFITSAQVMRRELSLETVVNYRFQ
jgi:hypothetical protein